MCGMVFLISAPLQVTGIEPNKSLTHTLNTNGYQYEFGSYQGTFVEWNLISRGWNLAQCDAAWGYGGKPLCLYYAYNNLFEAADLITLWEVVDGWFTGLRDSPPEVRAQVVVCVTSLQCMRDDQFKNCTVHMVVLPHETWKTCMVPFPSLPTPVKVQRLRERLVSDKYPGERLYMITMPSPLNAGEEPYE